MEQNGHNHLHLIHWQGASSPGNPTSDTECGGRVIQQADDKYLRQDLME